MVLNRPGLKLDSRILKNVRCKQVVDSWYEQIGENCWSNVGNLDMKSKLHRVFLACDALCHNCLWMCRMLY